MVIDSHQHVFWHGRDDAEPIVDMDAQSIGVAWLLSWEALPHEDEAVCHTVLNPVHRRADRTHPGIPLSDLLAARANYPDRFIVGYCPPSTGWQRRCAVRSRVPHSQSPNMRGVVYEPIHAVFPLDRPVTFDGVEPLCLAD